MTKTSARMELTRLRDLNASAKLPLEVDEEDMLVFLPDEETHADHVFWRGMQNSAGDWAVEQCVDPVAGTCSVRRVWRTPQDRAAQARMLRETASP